MWTPIMPEGVQRNIIWATINCNDEILIGGHSNLMIVDILEPIPYTMAISSTDGIELARCQNYLPTYDQNTLHRSLNYNCQYNNIQFNEVPRYFPPVSPGEFGGFKHHESFMVKNNIFDTTHCRGSIGWPRGQFHVGCKAVRAIIDWYAYTTTSNLIRTSDKGYLLATFNAQVIGYSPFFGTLFDTISYMQIIKYDSLGRTTILEPRKATHSTQALKIAPNPATHSITFPGVGAGIITLVDTKGKVWLKRELTANQSLEISLLPTGLYTARLQTAEGLQLQGRFAKE
jgi:hypothetical protein